MYRLPVVDVLLNISVGEYPEVAGIVVCRKGIDGEMQHDCVAPVHPDMLTVVAISRIVVKRPDGFNL